MIDFSTASVFLTLTLLTGCQKSSLLGTSPMQPCPHLRQATTSAEKAPCHLSPKEPKTLSPKRIPAAPIPWAPLPDPTVPLSRIAFGSCSSQFRKQMIWPQIAAQSPDLFLHLGDMIYADMMPYGKEMIPRHVSVVEKARVDYALLAAQSTFRSFSARIPMLHTWDDHDFGQNDAGGDFLYKKEMEALFLEFVGAGRKDPRRTRPGVYHATAFGPVGRRTQIILLDTRSFRSALKRDERSRQEKEALGIVGTYAPHSDPTTSLLGAEQWSWLEKELEKPADLRLIVSSIQVIADEKGVESWGNFPHEQARLRDLIVSTHANGVLLLSGDVHFAEISKSDAGPYPLYDFTSSNLAQTTTHWGRNYKNSYRVLGTLDEENFGLIEVDWQQEATLIHLRALQGDGKEAFAMAVPLSQLSL